MWRKIDGKVTWIALSRLRNSFLSRAMLALSLSALVLSHLNNFLEGAGIDTLSLRLLFFGGFVFLVGYVLFGIWTPLEFSQPGELHDHVSRMSLIADEDFDRSRLTMADSLYARFASRNYLTAPAGLLQGLIANIRAAKAYIEVKSEANSERSSSSLSQDRRAGLFHADLALRQHDLPIRRLIVCIVIALGAILLILPTVINAVRVVFRF